MELYLWLKDYIELGVEPSEAQSQNLIKKFKYLKKRLPEKNELDALSSLYRKSTDRTATATAVLFYRLAEEWGEKDPLVASLFRGEIKEKEIKELLSSYRQSLIREVLKLGETAFLFEKRGKSWEKTGELPTPAVYLILKELSKGKEPWGEYYSFTVKELAEEVFLPLFGIGEWELSRKIRGLQAHRLIDAEIRADLDNVFLPTEAIC